VAPEWFYKGRGTILRAHGDPLAVPAFAEDGGEEPEVAGIYIIDAEGRPRRVGMAMANEFSDHKFEKKNYLYLAHSKLRNCSMGPELVINPEFSAVPGTVSVERGGRVLWSKSIATGEAKMSHTLANLEHHHFKYDEHRRPGDAHIHFFGADAFSFGDVHGWRNTTSGHFSSSPRSRDRLPSALCCCCCLSNDPGSLPDCWLAGVIARKVIAKTKEKRL